MGTITKYKKVQVAYEVETVSASHVSRLLSKMESPRQVPTWGDHTTGSMHKRVVEGYDNYWGWEVTKPWTYKNQSTEQVYVTYTRNSQMSSGRIEIEAIKVYLEEQGFEVSEPNFTFRKSYRRDANGDYVDYEEEDHVRIEVRKPEKTFSGHCQTCMCEHAEDL